VEQSHTHGRRSPAIHLPPVCTPRMKITYHTRGCVLPSEPTDNHIVWASDCIGDSMPQCDYGAARWGLVTHPSSAAIMERGGALPAIHTRLTCRNFRLCCFTCCSRFSHTVGTPAASNNNKPHGWRRQQHVDGRIDNMRHTCKSMCLSDDTACKSRKLANQWFMTRELQIDLPGFLLEFRQQTAFRAALTNLC
jgi:hypothetical protein